MASSELHATLLAHQFAAGRAVFVGRIGRCAPAHWMQRRGSLDPEAVLADAPSA
jgi:hypothetical protein